MKNSNLLIVFLNNNSDLKTRFSDSGIDKAMLAYQSLLQSTFGLSYGISCDKAVYYPGRIMPDDNWRRSGFMQRLQEGENTGERMLHAFKEAFQKQYKKVVLVNNDCLDVESSLIRQAFHSLNRNQVVIGPESNGGYYLIGLTALAESLFLNKNWSSATVLKDTISDVVASGRTFHLVPPVNEPYEETIVPNEPDLAVEEMEK